MENNKQENNQNGAPVEPTAEQGKNWKQVAANWCKRAFWAGIGAGITIGITALKNRKKNRQA